MGASIREDAPPCQDAWIEHPAGASLPHGPCPARAPASPNQGQRRPGPRPHRLEDAVGRACRIRLDCAEASKTPDPRSDTGVTGGEPVCLPDPATISDPVGASIGATCPSLMARNTAEGLPAMGCHCGTASLSRLRVQPPCVTRPVRPLPRLVENRPQAPSQREKHRDQQRGDDAHDKVHPQPDPQEVGEAVAAGAVDQRVRLVADRRGEGA